ncbi:MAG: peptidoglycan DD-metalloendopeptidase family protein [Legionellales bacterium]|nr:peptidoglycan DD-metalloendopeptidase family protein [Legionellales bacterium]
MAQPLHILPIKSGKSIKYLALAAVAIILLISFFLVKFIYQPQKNDYAHQSISLPDPSEEGGDSDLEEDSGWTVVQTRSGDSLASIFKHVGLSRQALQAVLKNNPYAKDLAKIKPGQQLQFFIRDNILEQLMFPISPTQFLIVSQKEGKYTSALKSRTMNRQNNYVTATVRGSLYGTAKGLNIPYKLIRQMTEIFNWEIDFIKDIRSGDQFSMVYEAFYIEDKLVSTGNILAVTYTNRSKKHQAIRHLSATGDEDYFTEEGRSLKKAFSRYPIKFSHISSPFSLSRYHPILHYKRPHKGVDLAAPIGTPIYATGNGRIELIDRHSGYGNMIQIVHDKTYTSIYAHLLKFQKGLSKGNRVKRGQVIGYVGQTGLADGPHCHYEFHINHQPKNPTTVALPRSSPLSGREMASFKAKTAMLLAQLKLFEDSTLATKNKKNTDTA